MSGRRASLERRAPGRHGHRLRWARVATLAAVLLVHLGFLAFLLASPPGWRWAAAEMSAASPDALVVRLLSPRSKPTEPLRPAMPRPPQSVRAAYPASRSRPVAQPTHATAQAAPPTPAAAPRSIDSLIVAAPPSYVAGGGRLSGPGYGRQNVRVPGSSQPVRGVPVFRMADPRMQGIAGVVRFIGHLTGAVDPHCLKLDAESGMTIRERIANHVDADDAQMAATAERYGCPDPLKPGAPMYYLTH
ncbi:hypothetical protein ABQJ54_08070 [Rhodanobacter sp. Si-c]|uniref:Energy transducer TonB n=1 Tax=Rhodanobacter lycopersici TaxID=3162487 RepID=A0ABV3QD78_9GAMM